MSADACSWSTGKACARIGQTGECDWVEGKRCVQFFLEALQERLVHGYRRRFGATVIGAAIACLVVFFRNLVAEPSWAGFWSDPQAWVPITIGWPVICLLIAVAVAWIEKTGEVRTFFYLGVTSPTFVYALLGFAVGGVAGLR